MSTAGIAIRPLTPASAKDFFAFFEGEAFADNPSWAACYCHFVHFNHAAGGWKLDRPDTNKAASASLIDRGQLRGYFAYDGATPVGWVNAAPSANFPAGNLSLAGVEAATLGQILCFVVAPRWRKKGVARLLLDAACSGLREQGMTMAQGNPRAAAEADSANHFGPLSLFLHAGFAVHSRDESDGSLYVRKALI